MMYMHVHVDQALLFVSVTDMRSEPGIYMYMYMYMHKYLPKAKLRVNTCTVHVHVHFTCTSNSYMHCVLYDILGYC